MRYEESENDAREPRRDGSKNDEWIHKRPELGHQNEINENDGKDQANGKPFEGFVHPDYSATHGDADVLAGFQFRDQLIDFVVDRAEIFRCGHDVDVDNPANLIVIDLRRSADGDD